MFEAGKTLHYNIKSFDLSAYGAIIQAWAERCITDIPK